MIKLPLLLCAVMASVLTLAQSAVGVPHKIVTGVSADRWAIVNPVNVQAIDGNFVESKPQKLCQANICFQDFKFSIPSNAVVQGIDVRITRKKKVANTVKDVTVALLRPINDTEALGKGPNLAKPDLWTESVVTVLYPFPATATDGNNQVFQWTAAELNHPALSLFFGISSGTGKGAIFMIDKVELTIKYLQGTTTYTQTSTSINASSIQLKQLGNKFQVSVAQKGRYTFTVMTTAGVVVQQTTINSDRLNLVPLNANLKGYYIITVEGNHQKTAQLAYLQ